METALGKARREKGVTQQECAEETGISLRTIKNYESGAPIANSLYLYKLAKYYGVTMEELINQENHLKKSDSQLE